ncbi:MAG: UDP-2,3-diacylglucosamine diphosphatase LpxI [Alphaproteobacteria bacterium]|nr:UDP-2,3-diacylglucosamine diphosphatase LpxI [Alphaproteobacteria bacterium]
MAPAPEHIGIIAGGGALPRLLAEAAERGGLAPFVAMIEGVAAPDDFSRWPARSMPALALARIASLMREAGCRRLVLAGHLPRPNLAALVRDRLGRRLLPRALAAALRGDGALLDLLAKVVEAEGFVLEGVQALAPELLIGAGALGRLSPEAEHFVDVRLAAAAALRQGRRQRGQGAIACAGRLLGVEDAAGTDALLARIPPAGPPRSGVLVKRPRPRQDPRLDLPAIGPETVIRAAAAGLAGVVVAAGAALVIGREETARAADEAGLFVFGASAGELGG